MGIETKRKSTEAAEPRADERNGFERFGTLARMVRIKASVGRPVPQLTYFNPWDVVAVAQGQLGTNGTITLTHHGQTLCINYADQRIEEIVEAIQDARSASIVELFAGQVQNAQWDQMLGVVARLMARELGGDKLDQLITQRVDKIAAQAVETELENMVKASEKPRREA